MAFFWLFYTFPVYWWEYLSNKNVLIHSGIFMTAPFPYPGTVPALSKLVAHSWKTSCPPTLFWYDLSPTQNCFSLNKFSLQPKSTIIRKYIFWPGRNCPKYNLGFLGCSIDLWLNGHLWKYHSKSVTLWTLAKKWQHFLIGVFCIWCFFMTHVSNIRVIQQICLKSDKKNSRPGETYPYMLQNSL